MAPSTEASPLLARPARRPLRRSAAAACVAAALGGVAYVATAGGRGRAGPAMSDLARRESMLRALGPTFASPVLRALWTDATVARLADMDAAPDAHFTLSIRDDECSPDGYTRLCANVQCLAAATAHPTAAAECLAMNNATRAQGPTLRLRLGDVVDVTTTNDMKAEAESLHFHGMHFPGTPYYDGASMVAQAPLAPGQTMTQRFVAYPAGTYFYHGHQGLDYADGLRGIVVVEDDFGSYYDAVVDTEDALLFSEWIHMEADQQYAMHLGQGGGAAALTGGFIALEDRDALMDGVIATVWWTSGIVNGVGAYGPLSDEEQTLTAEMRGQTSDAYRVRVRHGETAKLRLVHGGWFYGFKFAVDDHEHVIVAASGTDVAPVAAYETLMLPAERWDVLVTANQPCGNYSMTWQSHIGDAAGGGHAAGDEGYLTEAKGNFSAVLEYVDCAPGAPAPAGVVPAAERLGAARVDEFRSLAELGTGVWRSAPRPSTPPVPEKADRTVALNVSFNVVGVLDGINWNFNKNIFQDATAPLYATKGADHVSRDEYFETKIYDVALGEVVDLEIYFPYQDLHSIHLHGYKFWVVEAGPTGVGDAKTNNATDDFEGQEGFRVPKGANYVDPPYVDTVMLSEYSYVKLRVLADNPGMWHFHCHFLFHMMQGLQTVFNVGEAQQPPPPPAWWQAMTYDQYAGPADDDDAAASADDAPAPPAPPGPRR